MRRFVVLIAVATAAAIVLLVTGLRGPTASVEPDGEVPHDARSAVQRSAEPIPRQHRDSAQPHRVPTDPPSNVGRRFACSAHDFFPPTGDQLAITNGGSKKLAERRAAFFNHAGRLNWLESERATSSISSRQRYSRQTKKFPDAVDDLDPFARRVDARTIRSRIGDLLDACDVSGRTHDACARSAAPSRR